MKKKIIIVGLICSSLLPFGSNVVEADTLILPFEEDMDEITPRYVHAKSAKLSYSSGKANCNIIAKNKSARINITIYLEKWNGSRWIVQSSNSKSGTGFCNVPLNVSKSSGKYQIRFYATVNGEVIKDSKSI